MYTDLKARYSDVHHEILPVSSGMRWVLTYNLVRDNPEGVRPTPSPSYPGLEQALTNWVTDGGAPYMGVNSLVYLLEH